MASGNLGILVGGGPAPGLNGVIGSATIVAREHGLGVVGFYDGFEHLMAGDPTKTEDLTIDRVSRIHFRGGSILRTSRANPTKKPESLENCVKVLKHHNIRYMITIGGDDTAFSASKLAEVAGGDLSVVHVPKTIDNDLPLPPGVPTFGYQTARHVGVGIVSNLMADAQTATRFYLVVAMGRSAGHLALGIGKAAGAALTLIPEEWQGAPIRFQEVADMIEGTVIKRRSMGKPHGVIMMAEGLLEHMPDSELEAVFGKDHIDRDEHDRIRLDNLELGRRLKKELTKRLADRGCKTTFVSKNLGYELRCADPIPYDIEYTRDLGYAAVGFLLGGGSNALMAFHGGRIAPLKFDEMPKDPKTGRPVVRRVDIEGETYQCARSYMIRLSASDKGRLAELAKAGNTTPEEIEKQFGYLMK